MSLIIYLHETGRRFMHLMGLKLKVLPYTGKNGCREYSLCHPRWVERMLASTDLMICDETGPLCMQVYLEVLIQVSPSRQPACLSNLPVSIRLVA